MEKFDIKLAKKTVRFLTSNLSHIKKLNVENFSEKCFVYIYTNKCIFNISISDKLVVEIDNNQDRFNKYFYNETYNFVSVEQFKSLFNNIVLRATKREEDGLSVIYKGNLYPVFVEISNIDSDRSKGIEKLYDLTIYDSKGTEHFVAQVSEYPLGTFNLVNIFDNFKVSENEIIDYFYEKY